MSTFKEIKRDLLYDLACSPRNGWRELETYQKIADNAVPTRLLDKWLKKFYRTTPINFTLSPRVVNHFKLGADPEFVFMSDGVVVNASELGLLAGLAIGADNNGRLAELRPKPSKSALMIVASLYAELCFLAQWNPSLVKFTWKASPFEGKDGLGGHIHFSRWKDEDILGREVASLDRVTMLLERAGCVDMKAQRNRLATKLYGKYGDIRTQMHGYEYRTFPSWLGNPRHAHLYLTLAKLSVHEPKMFELKHGLGDATTARQYIENILAFYQDIDDDAKIARCYVKHCWLPPHGDIQKGWGIYPLFKYAGDCKTDILPPSIGPDTAHVEDMFYYLTTGIRHNAEKKAFEPLRFPEGYLPFQKYINTDRHPDLGEMVWDMAMAPIGFTVGKINSHAGPDSSLRLSRNIYKLVVSKLGKNEFETPYKRVCGLSVLDNTDRMLNVSFPNWLLNKQYSKWFKKFLTEEGVFPFVRLGQEIDPLKWKIKQDEQLLLRA